MSVVYGGSAAMPMTSAVAPSYGGASYATPSYATPSYATQSYAMPQQSYAMPTQSYAMPQQSYAMPQQSYVMPQQSYAMPQQSYAMPSYGGHPFGGMPPFAGMDAAKITEQQGKVTKFLEDQKKAAEDAAMSQLSMRQKLINDEASQQLRMVQMNIEVQKKQELAMLENQFNQHKWSNDQAITQKEMEIQQQATSMAMMSQQYKLQAEMYSKFAKTGVNPAMGMNPMASYVPPPMGAGGFPGYY